MMPSESLDKIKLKCLIVDDEEIAIEGIIGYVEKLNRLEVSATCSCALEAIEVLKKQEIDLMLLDINMPDLSGLEFLETLEMPPLTIFTTAYSEYALDGFRLNVVDYLLKPYSFQRFYQAVQKAITLYESQIYMQNSADNRHSTMYIRQGEAFISINWQKIMFVESMQNYLKLHCEDRTFVIHQTMISLEELLPKEAFYRIHKSFLVNLSFIDKITKDRLYVQGIPLPISKYRKEELMQVVVYRNLMSK